MKGVVHNLGPGEPGCELGVTSARVHVRVDRVVVVCRCTFFTGSEQGPMVSATAVNAVPVLEDVHVGTTQEWF